jgi:hypothetical protein
MSIIARLRFAGRLERDAAAVSWRQVLARHPLLRAVVVERRRQTPNWAPADTLPPLQWTNDSLRDHLPAIQPISLTREPGLRGWVSADVQQSTVVLQVHHSACDGKGVLQVVDDFLHSYARAADRGRCFNEQPPRVEALLAKRGTFGLTAMKLLKLLPAQLTGLLGAGKFMLRQPVPLLANESDIECRLAGRVPDSIPAVRTGRLEADELRRLSAAAADRRVTVNDWLLRDCFLAVDDFRRRHGAPGKKDWIRISVPMNLRQPSDERMPAANVVSMVFLDRNSTQCIDPSELLDGIHNEMALIRRRQLGLTFIWSLHALRAAPGGMAGRVGNGRCEATCVVTNLGRALADSLLPKRGGKLVAAKLLLEDIEVFAPIREGTAATIGLVFYADGLNICLQYDGRRMTAVQSDDLLSTYLQTIRASLGAAMPARGDKAA